MLFPNPTVSSYTVSTRVHKFLFVRFERGFGKKGWLLIKSEKYAKMLLQVD